MIDGKTAKEIDQRVAALLAEAGFRDPPIDVRTVIEHLKINHSYYDLADPTLVQEVLHKVKIGSRRLVDLLKKVKLSGLWLPDQERIVIDSSLVELKRKWVNAHEIAHRLLPAHRMLFLGDTAETLDPEYHEMLEAEANYGASALIFFGARFTRDSRDLDASIKSIQALAKLYANTLATTLRRFVEHGHDRPLVGLVTTPRGKALPEDQTTRVRALVTSPAFKVRFRNVRQEQLLNAVDRFTYSPRGGPCGAGTFALVDVNGASTEFSTESFFNRYYVLTLMVGT